MMQSKKITVRERPDGAVYVAAEVGRNLYLTLTSNVKDLRFEDVDQVYKSL
jgi:hypothetical protein